MLLLLLACRADPVPSMAPRHWEEIDQIDGIGRGLAQLSSGVVVATDGGLLHAADDQADWVPLAAEGLPEGAISFVDAMGPTSLLAWVHGAGLYRSVDDGATFSVVSSPPQQPLMSALNPRGQVYPTDTAITDDGRVWLAGIGGLFYSDDEGDTFQE